MKPNHLLFLIAVAVVLQISETRRSAHVPVEYDIVAAKEEAVSPGVASTYDERNAIATKGDDEVVVGLPGWYWYEKK